MPDIFKQRPFSFSILVLIILITLHIVGSHYSLYWKYVWYDIIVHIISGFWVALLILWLASVLGQVNSLKEYKAKSFLIAFVASIIVGIFWELFENIGQITYIQAAGYYLDTTFDILSDGLGGLLAYFYFTKKRKCLEEACDVLHPFYNQTGLIKN
jgi:hypothetical protein